MTNPITQFDRYNIKTMRAEVEAALKTVADKYGLVIGLGRITFTGNEFRGKITAVTKSALNSPAAIAPQRAPEYAALKTTGRYQLGLTSQDIDDCDFGPDARIGGTCKFIGYSPRRHKYPFTIRTSGGKTLKVTRYTAQELAAKKIVKAA